MNPFFNRPLDRPAIMLMMSEEEFIDALRNANYGEHAIELEVENLRLYREKFKLNVKPPAEVDEDTIDPDIISSLRRRRNENRKELLDNDKT